MQNIDYCTLPLQKKKNKSILDAFWGGEGGEFQQEELAGSPW